MREGWSMEYYLSSYKIGNEAGALRHMMWSNKRIGYIPNALDSIKFDPERKVVHIKSDMDDLKRAGLDAELLDLRDYFGKKTELRARLNKLGGIWISGGNVFVLRQAMKLSELDDLLEELSQRKDFVYGGYSAAGCVLSPDLKAYKIVDDATDMPYPEIKRAILKGIGLIDYALMPHYESDHPESESIGKEVEYCKRHNIPYKTLRDGEVILIR
jgi:dipeptidase E